MQLESEMEIQGEFRPRTGSPAGMPGVLAADSLFVQGAVFPPFFFVAAARDIGCRRF
jgi:hypothetical protein